MTNSDGRSAREALSQPIEDWPYAQDKLLTYLDPELIEKHGYAQLGRALNLGRVVCVVGSGAAAGFGMPPWIAFLEVAGGVISGMLGQEERIGLNGPSMDDFDNTSRKQRHKVLLESLQALGVRIRANAPVEIPDPAGLNFPVVLELVEKLFIEVATFLDRKLLPDKARDEFRNIIKRLLGDLMGGAENLMRRTLQRVKTNDASDTFLASLVLHILENKPLGSRRNIAPISAVDGLPALLALKLLQQDGWRAAAPPELEMFPGYSLPRLDNKLASAIRIASHDDTGNATSDQKAVYARICNQPSLAFLRDHLVARLAALHGAAAIEKAIMLILQSTVADSRSQSADRELREWINRHCALETAKLDAAVARLPAGGRRESLMRQRVVIRQKVHELEARLALTADQLRDDKDRYDVNRQRPVLIPRHRDTLSALYDTLRINRFITTNYDTELERLLATRGYRVTDVDSAKLQSGAGPIMSVRTINWLGSRGQDFVLGRRNAADLIDFATQGRADAVQIFHLHGRATDDTDIVLTERDYVDLYMGEDRVREVTDDALRLAFSANPLLFVGVGMTEEDVLRPLRAFMTRDLTLTDRPAVALLPATKSLDDCAAKAMTLMSRYGVYTIHYGRGRFERSAAASPTSSREPPKEEHILRTIVDRCSGLGNLATTLKAGFRPPVTRSASDLQTSYGAPLERVAEIHGSPSESFPIDVELQLLNIIRASLFSLAMSGRAIDSDTHTDIDRLLTSLKSAFQTPFCCAALHEMRQKWLDWRSDWGRLPQPRDPGAPPQASERPIEIERHAVRLRDLGFESAVRSLEQARLAETLTASPASTRQQDDAIDIPDLEQRIRRQSCAPITDRFFSSPPSPSFEGLREALEILPKSPDHLPMSSRIFLFMGDRGLGKGQFFAAMQEARRFADICQWLNIGDPSANPKDADAVTLRVHRAFFNLGLSNEYLSVFDQLSSFLERTLATFESPGDQSQDITSLRHNRIGRLQHALERLSAAPARPQARIVVAINHVNTFFEASGRPKNAQVALLWNTLLDPAYDKAPIDYIFVTNGRTIPGVFRENREAEADTLVGLPREYTDNVSFKHLVSRYATPGERRRINEQIRTTNLRLLSSDTVLEMRRKHYVHILRRTRPEVFAARFFPLATEGLARIACQTWNVPGEKAHSAPRYMRGDTYGRYACRPLTPEEVELELQRLQDFQLQTRAAFEHDLVPAGGDINVAARLDLAISRAVALHALAHRHAPGKTSSKGLRTYVVNALQANGENAARLKFLADNHIPDKDYQGLFDAVEQQFHEVSDIAGESRFAFTLILSAISDVYEGAIRAACADFAPSNNIKVKEPLAATMADADTEVASFLSALRLATAGRRPESREDVVMSVVLDFYDRHQANHPVWPFAPSWHRSSKLTFTDDGIDCSKLTPLDFYQIEEITEFVAGTFAASPPPDASEKPCWPSKDTRFLRWSDTGGDVDRLRRYLLLDTAVGACLDNAPGGLVGALTETILVALSLIGQPVSPDVLLACPDVRAATLRLCRAVSILPIPALAERLPVEVRRSCTLGPVAETEAVRLALIGVLDLMVHRCLIFRLGAEDRTLPAGRLSRQRFAAHKSIRRHIHNVIDAPMVDQAEVDLLTFSLFASQPNELPRPNPAAHGRLMKMIDALIAYEEPERGENFPEIDPGSGGDPRSISDNSRRMLERVRRQRRRKLQRLRAAYGILRSIYSVGVVSGLHVAGATLGAAPPGGLLEQYRLKVRWAIKRCVQEQARAKKEENRIREISPALTVAPDQSSPFYGDEIAWLYNECGVISLVQGKLGDAAALFERATHAVQKWIESSGTGPLHNRISMNAALCDIERGATRQARRYLKQIQSSHFENDIMKAIARGYTALIDHLAGNFDPAQSAYEKAIDFLISMRRNRAASILSRHLVDLHIARGDQGSLDAAQTHIKNAMNLAADGGHEDVRHGVLITRTRLAMYRSASTAADMFAQLRTVDSYAKAAGIPRLVCEAALMRGQIQIRNGDYHGAGLEARAALEIATRHDLQLRKISAMILFAQVLKGTDQKHEAQPLLLRAMALADRAQFYLARDAAERLTA